MSYTLVFLTEPQSCDITMLWLDSCSDGAGTATLYILLENYEHSDIGYTITALMLVFGLI